MLVTKLITRFAVLLVAYCAIFLHVSWAYHLITFLTILSAIIFFTFALSDKENKTKLAEGMVSHSMSRVVDDTFYFIIILMLASGGYYLYAFIWFIRMGMHEIARQMLRDDVDEEEAKRLERIYQEAVRERNFKRAGKEGKLQ